MIEISSSSQFNKLISSSKPTLVDFSAEYSIGLMIGGPCKALSPKLEQLEQTHKQTQFLKVDVDQNQDLSSQYKVTAMPTIVFFRGGSEVGRVVGADLGKITEFLNSPDLGSSSSTFQGQGQTLSGKKASAPSTQKQSDSTVMFVVIGVVLAYLYLTKDSV